MRHTCPRTMTSALTVRATAPPNSSAMPSSPSLPSSANWPGAPVEKTQWNSCVAHRHTLAILERVVCQLRNGQAVHFAEELSRPDVGGCLIILSGAPVFGTQVEMEVCLQKVPPLFLAVRLIPDCQVSDLAWSHSLGDCGSASVQGLHTSPHRPKQANSHGHGSQRTLIPKIGSCSAASYVWPSLCGLQN